MGALTRWKPVLGLVASLILIIILATRLPPNDVDSGPQGSDVNAYGVLTGTVVFSEVVTSNSGLLVDEDGDAEDWFEVHNRSDNPINLQNWFVGRRDQRRSGWKFPETTLIPGERLVVFASGKNRSQPDSEWHTDFVLPRGGVTLWLRPPDSGQFSDVINVPAVPRGSSYGRGEKADEVSCFFLRPHPGRSNGFCHLTSDLGAPQFSLMSGFFNDAITVTISAEDPDAPIFYTLDGSTPDPQQNPHTRRYDGPLLIGPRPESPPALLNLPSIFPSEFFTSSWAGQPHKVRGTPQQATVLRARTTDSADTTATYFVGGGFLRDSLPIISLVIDPDELADHERGIHVTGLLLENYLASSEYNPDAHWRQVPANFRETGLDWRRPILGSNRTSVIELCEPTAMCGVQTRVQVGIHGNFSRFNPLKSFRIYADDPWETHFPPDLFGESGPIHRRILLRNSGQDFRGLMLRDAYLHGLMSHFDADTQHYRPSVVFVNGEYWGIMNLRERYDQHYLESVYGSDRSRVSIVAQSHEVEHGDPSEGQNLRDLQTWIANTDASSPEYRSMIESKIDLQNFFDFLIAHLFTANSDWPGNNTRAWRQRPVDESLPAAESPNDGRWRWMIFDLDRSGEALRFNSDYNPFAVNMSPDLTLDSQDGYPAMFHQMMQHPGIRTDFLNRFADHLNTSFLPERTVSELEQITSVLSEEIDRHLDRWGPHESSQVWWRLVDRQRQFMQLRPAIQRRHLEELFNMDPSVEMKLLVDGRGQVRVNTVLIDPSTPGVTNDREWTGRYWPEHPIRLEALAEGGARFLRWEGVSTAEATRPVVVLAPQEAIRVRAVFSS